MNSKKTIRSSDSVQIITILHNSHVLFRVQAQFEAGLFNFYMKNVKVMYKLVRNVLYKSLCNPFLI